MRLAWGDFGGAEVIAIGVAGAFAGDDADSGAHADAFGGAFDDLLVDAEGAGGEVLEAVLQTYLLRDVRPGSEPALHNRAYIDGVVVEHDFRFGGYFMGRVDDLFHEVRHCFVADNSASD